MLASILNISDLAHWFETLGWKKSWEWGSPPSFGGVNAGHFEIFLCRDDQGGRGQQVGCGH